MCDFKSHTDEREKSLIWELRLYKFNLDHNAADAIKNICCEKGEGAVDYSTVSRLLKNLNDQARSDKSEAMLQAIVADLASSTWRVTEELKISVYCGSSPS